MTIEEIINGLQNASSYAIDQYYSTHNIAYYDTHKLIDCVKQGFIQLPKKEKIKL